MFFSLKRYTALPILKPLATDLVYTMTIPEKLMLNTRKKYRDEASNEKIRKRLHQSLTLIW